MILGIGTDIVVISRIAGLLERRGARAIERVFTLQEARFCHSRGAPAASFAVRFAAKEAFYKAMGTGVGSGGSWTDVEVLSSASGAPELRLHSTAAASASARGVRRMHLSLSHTGEHALAFVVLEG
jgi:holo-[acyl-carrier protein] synthase